MDREMTSSEVRANGSTSSPNGAGAMAQVPRAKHETELYPPITALLDGKGLHVWTEATIRAGDEGARRADHVAWRWDGDDIDALSVEVKPGAADAALAQSVAYCVGFDRVYVAAEDALSDAGYMRRVLRISGLATSKSTSEKLESSSSRNLEASSMPRRGKPEYSEVLHEWRLGDEVARLAALLDHAKTLSGSHVGPHFEVRLDLWPHERKLTEERAKKEFGETAARLGHVRARLNQVP